MMCQSERVKHIGIAEHKFEKSFAVGEHHAYAGRRGIPSIGTEIFRKAKKDPSIRLCTLSPSCHRLRMT